MLFNCPVTASNGVAVAHHRLARIEAAADLHALRLYIECWPTEAARLDGAEPATRWHVAVQATALPWASGYDAALLAAIQSDEAFASATAVPDAGDTLDAAQARKWSEVKGERAARLAGSFEWAGHLFNVDPINLTGAAVDAMLADAGSEAYVQAWVLANNSVIELDAQQQIAVGRACKDYIASLWAASQALRAQIYAAASVEAVTAIHWPT